MKLPQTQPWYKQGLRFECTGCGGCCTGAPGYVWVTEEEIEAIANHLNLSVDYFSKKYVRVAEGKYSLKETLPNNDCVFLQDKRCTVYEVRPVQCRTFPFWTHLLKSKKEWEEAAKSCEGIRLQSDETAPLVPFDEIENRRNQTTVV
jgi:Fe-S-cluster containining protein